MKRLVVIVALLLPGLSFAQPLLNNFHYITAEQGLSDPYVQCVYQDHDGFIWFGTTNGLNRYDGYSIKQYLHDNRDSLSLLDNFVMNVAEYRNVLVVVTRSGISFRRPNKEAFINIKLTKINGINVDNSVFDQVSFAPDSSLLVTTDGFGLVVFPNSLLNQIAATGVCNVGFIKRLNISDQNEDRLYNVTTGVAFDARGRCWLTTYGGLVRFNYDHNKRDFGIGTLVRSRVIAQYLVINKDGYALGCTGVGEFFSFNANANSINEKVFKNITADINKLSIKNPIVKKDASDGIWIGLTGVDILVGKFVNGDLTVISSGNLSNVESRTIRAASLNYLFTDRQANVWIATTSGVAYSSLHTSGFLQNPVRTPDGYERDNTFVLRKQGSLLYYATNGNELNLARYTDGGYSRQRKMQCDCGLIYQLRYDTVYHRLWVASDKGLLTLDDTAHEELQPVYINNGHEVTRTSSVEMSLTLDPHSDTMYIGTGRRLQCMNRRTMQNRVVRLDSINAAIPATLIVRDALMAADRSVWAATDEGLVHYFPRQQRADYFPSAQQDSKVQSRFTTLFEDGKHNVWIGTYNEGLYRFDAAARSFVSYPIINVGSSYTVNATVADALGKIWVSTNKGLYTVSGNNLFQYPIAKALNAFQLNPNAAETSNGMLLFGHAGGIAAINPARANDYNYQAPLRITNFNVSDKSVFDTRDTVLSAALLAGRELELNPDQNFFSFEYALLDYANAPYATYQYKLEGLDNDWVNADGRRFASYTHLPPNKYTFRVRASVDDGVHWSTASPVPVRVSPHFYQTIWFVLCVAVLVVFLVWFYINLRYKELRERREREAAEDNARIKEMFLANMSHEIRTPLNAIIGINKLLLEKQPREEQVHFLKAVQQSSEHLEAIINDILDYSKIEVGKIEIEKIPFSLRAVMQTVHATLQVKADEKGLAFACKPSNETPDMLIGDPFRLTQVLLNLGSNAVKFTESGTVQILAQPVFRRADAVVLELKVIDTGIGIEEEQQSKIFESFTQGGTSTSRKYGGTGLGLSISKQLTELMGGTLNLHSKVDEGTVFTCVVEFALAHAPEPEQAQAVVTNDGNALRGRKVLLVEDNAFNQLVATETLRHRVPGIVIDIANNGVEALDKLATERYDVVLMDIVMPEMDGYETTQQLRASSFVNRDTYIIAMTANIYKSDIEKCYESGMNDVVKKPFDIEELLGKMKSAVEGTDVASGARRSV